MIIFFYENFCYGATDVSQRFTHVPSIRIAEWFLSVAIRVISSIRLQTFAAVICSVATRVTMSSAALYDFFLHCLETYLTFIAQSIIWLLYNSKVKFIYFTNRLDYYYCTTYILFYSHLKIYQMGFWGFGVLGFWGP